MWTTSQPVPASKESLQDLIANRIPAVEVGEISSEEEISALKTALLRNAMRTQSISQVSRLGISQYEQGVKVSKENYFALAAQARAEQKIIFSNSFNPLERLVNKIESAGFNASVLIEPGFGEYFAGSGKLRNGYSPIHVDYAPQDSAGWKVGEAEVQLAWNLYLDVPEQGGELLLWDRQWQPEDDRFQVPDKYYYDEIVVEGDKPLRFNVKAGQLLVINSRNYHAVSEVHDRLTCGSFISVFPNNYLGLWS